MIEENVARIREEIARAEAAAGRKPGSVSLCAATKMNEAGAIRRAIAAGEASKSGFPPERINQIVEEFGKYPHIFLRGFMAIPPVSRRTGDNIKYFSKMREHFVDISAKKYDNVSMECLSMGMSGDYLDAIAEGATMVRIGTAIFGARNYARP